MHQAGWNVLNHSYSHAAYGTTDYEFQITKNITYVKSMCGIDLTHFVVPSGDQGYAAPALANGMLTVNSNNNNYRGWPDGYRIDQLIDFNNFKLYKLLVCDANHDTTNIMQKINNAAAMSVNGKHYWWSDFTHHVGFESSGSSLLFPLFNYYMEHVAQQYGITGADNIWMAPTQDVYEYLCVRDHCLVSYTLSGNTLTLTIDHSAVPADLRTNALTLTIEADQNFTNVVSCGSQGLTYHGAGANKLINIQWASDNNSDNTWTGALSSSWNESGNWSKSEVPLPCANVIIQPGTPHTLHVTSTGNICNSLLICSGTKLVLDSLAGISISGNLTIRQGGALENNGIINLRGNLINLNP
jgi:hypothetical protein